MGGSGLNWGVPVSIVWFGFLKSFSLILCSLGYHLVSTIFLNQLNAMLHIMNNLINSLSPSQDVWVPHAMMVVS